MKKFLIGILTFISMQTFACHLVTNGSCVRNAYFTTAVFFNHSEVQIRYYGTTAVINTFITRNTGVSDTTFSIPIPTGDPTIKIQFRYRDNTLPANTGWVDWSEGYVESSTNTVPGCNLLAVKFQSFSASRIDENSVKVVFTVGDAINMKSFNIKVSKDATNWKTVKVIIPDALKPNTTYSVIIKL